MNNLTLAEFVRLLPLEQELIIKRTKQDTLGVFKPNIQGGFQITIEFIEDADPAVFKPLFQEHLNQLKP